MQIIRDTSGSYSPEYPERRNLRITGTEWCWKINYYLNDVGIDLLTMYDSRLRQANQIYDEVKRHFQELVFNTVIQRNVRRL